MQTGLAMKAAAAMARKYIGLKKDGRPLVSPNAIALSLATMMRARMNDRAKMGMKRRRHIEPVKTCTLKRKNHDFSPLM